MKAWIKREGRLRFDDVPSPIPSSEELLIRVQAISLNRGEIRTVMRAPEDAVPGWDAAGTVVAAARNGQGPPEGARVSCIMRAGAWAEFAAAPVANTAVVPESVGLDVASTLPVAALTVIRAFAVAGSLVGKRLLVTGATGGVGQFAVQLGLIAGANVTAVTTRESQHQLLRDLGAREIVATIDDAEGAYDLILESVGGNSLATAIDRVARDGVIVTIGNSSEQDTTFNARTLYGKGAARIYGLLIFEEVESRRVGSGDLYRLLNLVAEGRLRAPVELRRGWQELPSVLEELENRQYSGKAVLNVS